MRIRKKEERKISTWNKPFFSFESLPHVKFFYVPVKKEKKMLETLNEFPNNSKEDEEEEETLNQTFCAQTLRHDP